MEVLPKNHILKLPEHSCQYPTWKSHNPLIHKQEKNIPHQILKESEAQIHTDTNNYRISES
jgi:hypothetical protein